MDQMFDLKTLQEMERVLDLSIGYTIQRRGGVHHITSCYPQYKSITHLYRVQVKIKINIGKDRRHHISQDIGSCYPQSQVIG